MTETPEPAASTVHVEPDPAAAKRVLPATIVIVSPETSEGDGVSWNEIPDAVYVRATTTAAAPLASLFDVAVAAAGCNAVHVVPDPAVLKRAPLVTIVTVSPETSAPPDPVVTAKPSVVAVYAVVPVSEVSSLLDVAVKDVDCAAVHVVAVGVEASVISDEGFSVMVSPVVSAPFTLGVNLKSMLVGVVLDSAFGMGSAEPHVTLEHTVYPVCAARTTASFVDETSHVTTTPAAFAARLVLHVTVVTVLALTPAAMMSVRVSYVVPADAVTSVDVVAIGAACSTTHVAVAAAVKMELLALNTMVSVDTSAPFALGVMMKTRVPAVEASTRSERAPEVHAIAVPVV